MRHPFKSSALLSKPLPPPILSNVPGTWAFDTMNRRIKEEIFPRIIADNEAELTRPSSPLRAECLLSLNDLLASLSCGRSGKLRPLIDGGEDSPLWEELLFSIPEEQRNWLDAPWLVTEFYFYRRVIESFRFFETGYDMFALQKGAGLVASKAAIDALTRSLPYLLLEDTQIPPSSSTATQSTRPRKKQQTLEIGLLSSLWGNKMDLSLWPSLLGQDENTLSVDTGDVKNRLVDSSDSPQQPTQSSFILDNHLARVLDHLLGSPAGRVDIVVDNAGYELVSDLFLTHLLLSTSVAQTVTLHCKGHPTFVSDATPRDVYKTIAFLGDSRNNCPETVAFAKQLEGFVADKRLVIAENLFWCQPFTFWTPRAQQLLADSALVVVKGDANYRRLLGDMHWPFDTPAEEVLSYWTVPVVALRTLKAELACGISPEAQRRAIAFEKRLEREEGAETLDRNLDDHDLDDEVGDLHDEDADDKRWMVNGRWAVVQFYHPASSSPSFVL